jgi:hypothetical protein
LNWIDKPQLDIFAEKFDGEMKLPRLVAELILATSAVPDALRFLADESGRIRGFDGVLVSPGAPPFVPTGKSYWEFGCDKNIKGKATKDLRNRTNTVDPDDRAEATLVLVTPRHYDTPKIRIDQFIAEIRSGTGWNDVRFIDGQGLKHWLDMAPGVAGRWARTEFQSSPYGVCSVDEYWHRYSNYFAPTLREEVLLAGRGAQADEVVGRMAELQPDRITICADSPEEALAFAMAALRTAPDEVRLVLEARSLVVEAPEAARDLNGRPLIYFPTASAARSVGAMSSWGPTILAKGRRDVAGNAISLRRSSGHDFARALEQMGISWTGATQLAAECGRSVTVLARRKPGVDHPEPVWASNPATNLLPALLAGAWDSSNSYDRGIIALLADVKDYADWEALAQPYLLMDDPPLEYQTPIWKMRAPVDAFVNLGAQLGRGHFERLKQASLRVLAERDGNLDRSGTDLMMAGPGVSFSDWLREGLAATLLMTATLHGSAGFAPTLDHSGGPQKWVDDIIRQLPGLSNDERLLASLRGTLPILAEAAPLPFVEALERFVSGTPEGATWLFTEHKDFIHIRAHHTSLLWALETIAWDPRLVLRVCILLVRLAELDPNPESRLINRPIRSLRGILLPWLPGTNVDADARVGVLRGIRTTSEVVAWKLFLQLLPEHHAIGEPLVRPRLREAGLYDKGVEWSDARKIYAEAAKQLLAMVGGNHERWLDLIDHLPVLSDEDLSAGLQQLEAHLTNAGSDNRITLWRRLNDLFTKHVEFSDSEWALRGTRLTQIGDTVRRFTPADPVQLALPLFDDMRITLKLTAEEPELSASEVDDLRSKAVRELLATEGNAGPIRLAEAARNPWLVAKSLVAHLHDPRTALAFCKEAMAQNHDNSRALARALSGLAYHVFNDDWLKQLFNEKDRDAEIDDVVFLALGLRDEVKTWEFVDSLGKNVADAFWRARAPWGMHEHGVDVRDMVARRYLEVGKPMSALSAISDGKHLDPSLTFDILDQAARALNEDYSDSIAMTQRSVERIFKTLRSQQDVDINSLARREFTYLPLLAGPGRRHQNLALFDIMASDPTNFVEAIKLAFRPESAGSAVEETRHPERSHAAYNLLNAFRSIPGETASGVDAAAMSRWVRDAIGALTESDRREVGEHYIGKLMARAEKDRMDYAWPPSALRDIIEQEASESLERGLIAGRFNMRGVYSKGIYDGGDDERAFAREYRAWASTCGAWPRTARLLEGIASNWDAQAEREDNEAKKRLMKD